MKHRILYAALPLFFSLATSLRAEEETRLSQIENFIKTESYQIVDLADLKNRPFLDVTQQTSPLVIVKCPKDSLLPFTFFIRGDSLSTPEVSTQLQMLKDHYLIFFGEELFISTDFQNWKPLSQLWSGTTSYGIGLKEGIATVDLEFEFDQ